MNHLTEFRLTLRKPAATTNVTHAQQQQQLKVSQALFKLYILRRIRFKLQSCEHSSFGFCVPFWYFCAADGEKYFLFISRNSNTQIQCECKGSRKVANKISHYFQATKDKKNINKRNGYDFIIQYPGAA